MGASPFFVCAFWQAPRIPVGASLLAKASAHSAVMVPDTPHSRAGSLPQGNRMHPLDGRLPGRHREQAHSYNWNGCRQREIGRLSGRIREQARSHRKAKQRSCPRRSRPTQQ
ncbi:hypothetical protein PspCFBP13508_07275 [Pseudomonas sp. CFBP13508]|nr:hypothetical protein PspCFBP13508_07275 [Pseudomonas sp. CFBP13508]